jgi:hypothetical protein
MNYITSAELARKCDVSRAAVAIAIREHRISPDKVRRAGGRVMVEERHGLSVLGHHRKTKTSPSPTPAAVAAPAAADDLGALLAWGAPPIEPEGEPDELTGEAEVRDLEEQIEQWHRLVCELENLVAWWEGEYSDFREWITAKAAGSVLDTLEEHPAARHAVCETVAAIQAQLRAGLDEVSIQTSVK